MTLKKFPNCRNFASLASITQSFNEWTAPICGKETKLGLFTDPFHCLFFHQWNNIFFLPKYCKSHLNDNRYLLRYKSHIMCVALTTYAGIFIMPQLINQGSQVYHKLLNKKVYYYKRSELDYNGARHILQSVCVCSIIINCHLCIF